MKVLLLGGAGYIGSQLVEQLLNWSHLESGFIEKVTVLDNLMYDKTSLLKYMTSNSEQNELFEFVKGDVRDHSVLRDLIKKHDCIISLAALVGGPLCDKNPIDAQLVNFEANKFIAENKSKEQLLIYPNTNSGYGTTDGKSIITEENQLNPISIYGKTKCDAEKVIQQVDNHITFRLATVFGPSTRMRTDLLVNNLVLRAMKDKVLIVYEGSFMRNYIHVEDVCNAFVFCLKNWRQCKNQTYNVGNDEINMSKLQLCEKVKNHLPLEIIEAQITKDPDARNYIVSSQKFYNKGFKCQFDLDEGIRGLIKAYKLIDEPWMANY